MGKMKHDELLAKIDKAYETNLRMGADDHYHNAPEIKAIRAVVELHKPDKGMCNGCNTNPQAITTWAYPCPTIEAIEKELG